MLIFGTGQMAELADYYFSQQASRRISGFVSDPEYLQESTFLGKSVIPTEEVVSSFPAQDYDIFVAIGYSHGNLARSEKYSLFSSLGYTLPSYVSPKATILSDLKWGENCFILEDNTIQPFTKIGDNVVMWSGNHLGHHSQIGSHCFITSHVVISGNVSIGERCFVGVNATLRDGIDVGHDSVIGAGSLVMRSVPSGSLLAPDRTAPRLMTPKKA